MVSKGGNKGKETSRRSEDTQRQNEKDAKVARDPDIGGVTQRGARDVHQRDRRDRD